GSSFTELDLAGVPPSSAKVDTLAQTPLCFARKIKIKTRAIAFLHPGPVCGAGSPLKRRAKERRVIFRKSGRLTLLRLAKNFSGDCNRMGASQQTAAADQQELEGGGIVRQLTARDGECISTNRFKVIKLSLTLQYLAEVNDAQPGIVMLHP